MAFLLIIIISLVLQSFFQWWIIVPISFFICPLFCRSGKSAFLQSFLAIFFLWVIAALYLSVPNNHILASRVAQMLKLNSWWLLLLISGVSGGLISGISGFYGFYFFKINFRKI